MIEHIYAILSLGDGQRAFGAIPVDLDAQNLPSRTKIAHFEVLLQLLDRILDCLKGLEGKCHVIDKDRQDETNITLDIDINSCIRIDLGEANGLKVIKD